MKKISVWYIFTFTALFAASMVACTEGFQPQSDAVVKPEGEDLFQQKNIGNFDLSKTKKIVLTYDDGPTPEVTDALLKVLREERVKAAFFILGKSVDANQATLDRMRADGHVIANHSYSHANLAKKVDKTDLLYYVEHPEELLHQVVDSHRQIAKFMNPAHRWYFRAPYGAWTASHALRLNKNKEVRDYIGPVFWNAGGEISPAGTRPQRSSEIQTAADWDCWSTTKTVVEKGVKKVVQIPQVPVSVCAAGYFKEIERKQGGVILMHDVEMKTVEMSRILIPKLKAAGYEFVTLEDLRALDQYQ